MDTLADKLHREVVESASSLEDEAALTPMSYRQLVKKVFGEEISLDDAVDSCRFMADAGCITIGRLRSFFQDERIEQLLQRFRSARGSAACLRPLADRKHEFWLMWGTRYEGALALLDKLEQA